MHVHTWRRGRLSTHRTAWERMGSELGGSDGAGRSKGGTKESVGAGRKAAANREAENWGVPSSACFHPFDTVVGKCLLTITRIRNAKRRGKSRGATVGSEKAQFFGRTPSIFSSRREREGI